ncbi:MAG: GGDEF and EAL domain-containing protein [Butyrivibrio sp.]|nr:GGDEF and EAL domain-containing protein [Acetatifactor muris]MCM1558608.1 GGDEF and EAL domain-containing protein [Butyrivibrio sp.]
MNKDMNKDFSFKMLCDIAKLFAACMDDYLYVIDLTQDVFFITENALKRFALPDNTFRDIRKGFLSFVHSDDIAMLLEDLDEIVSGKKDDHNLKYRWMGLDGYPIWINCRGRLLRTAGVIPYLLVGCINEIGNSRMTADNVSGLLGESSLHERMKQMMPSLQNAMFMRLGIDDFKLVNERHGSDYGDYVLREVADCIQRTLGSRQYAYRIVSDEFMVLDLNDSGYNEMKRLYHRIRSEVDALVARESYKAIYTISAGLVSLANLENKQYDYTGYSEAMKLSEFALSEAKTRGRNQLYFFRQEDYSAFLRRRYLNSCLRQAVSDNFEGFELNFQPLVATDGELLYAAEALLRFRTRTNELISPAEFIPLLEESSLIIPVGRWVIRNALTFCKKMRERHPEFRVSINLSYIQLLKTSLFDDIKGALDELQLPPECLIAELTESGHLEDSAAVRSVWSKLKGIGVGIALDDFGKGYSNLTNIGNLRPSIIKIDRSFTLKALENSYEFDLLLHIIKMVHGLGLGLVVEGIETSDELARITLLEPDYIQGYYYSKPCTQKEFIRKYRGK